MHDRSLGDLAESATNDLMHAIKTAVKTEGNPVSVFVNVGEPILYEATKAAIDSMAAYFVACTEHDDASRHDPEGFL